MQILVVDDDKLVCVSLKKTLSRLGYDVETCQDATRAFDLVEEFRPDIMLLDIYLTVADGLDILKESRERYPDMPVLMITGFSDVKIAVKAMKLGAYDFLLKPIDLDQLRIALEKCVENLKLKRELTKYRELAAERELTREYFGKSKAIQSALDVVERLARTDDTTALIEGESGVGKEVVAKYLHQISGRNDKVFVTINCAAIPKELAESELFGHEKGAFTGAAQKTKAGKFELADGGTILLDEIGELTPDLQVKLLRALQEKAFYRLGGEKEISVDVRVVAATNKSLDEEVRAGRFREDLFYRLNVARVKIPPLRDRREDIPELVYKFVGEFSEKFGKDVEKVEPEAMRLLQAQYWRGNVRELRNAVERAALLLDGDSFDERSFAFLKEGEPEETPSSDEFVLRVPEGGVKIDVALKSLILQTLELTGGNQVRAARLLGLSRSKLRYRMEQLDIEVTKKAR
ncbi:MAG: response regulator [Ignavibacteriales bacterium]|nr:response regulator [Ignavibacteriales bacterium]